MAKFYIIPSVNRNTSSAVAPWGRGPRRALSAVDPLMSGVPLYFILIIVWTEIFFIVFYFVPLDIVVIEVKYFSKVMYWKNGPKPGPGPSIVL